MTVETLTENDIYDALLGLKNLTVSAAFAAQIVAKHGIEPAEMMAELGTPNTYSVSALFVWLGY